MLSKFYFYLKDKIQELELHLSGLIQKRLVASANSRLFYFSAIYLNLKLVLFEILSDIIKFLVIVFADPAQGFKLFYNQRDLQACPYSYSGFRQVQKKIRTFSSLGIATIVAVSVFSSLITNLIFGGKLPIWAATYNWTQGSWDTLSQLYAVHNNLPPVNWINYSAKDSGIATGTSLSLLPQARVLGQDSASDFGFGTHSGTQVSGSGSNGSLALAPGVVQAVNGNYNSYVVKSDGTVWAWGYGYDGRVGDGTGLSRNLPVQIATGAKSISVGGTHVLMIKTDGTIWSWGSNIYGSLGVNDTATRYAPVQVLGVGGSGYLTGIVAASAGSGFSMALAADGKVYAWGRNAQNQLGNGTVNQSLVPVQVSTATGMGKIVSVKSLYFSTLALDDQGQIWCWGGNLSGSCGIGNSTAQSLPVRVQNPNGVGFLSNIVEIAAGYQSSYALTASGLIYSWGENGNTQLGDNTNFNRNRPVQTTKINAGGGCDNNASGGTCTVLGEVRHISSMYSSGLALTASNTLWSWGVNTDGQLGDNTLTNRAVPVQITKSASGDACPGSLSGSCFVASDFFLPNSTPSGIAGMLIKGDGSIYGWGNNTFNQVGNYGVYSQLTPSLMIMADQAAAYFANAKTTGSTSNNLAVGVFNTVLIKADGTVWGWGSSNYGQLGDGGSGSSLPRSWPMQLTKINTGDSCTGNVLCRAIGQAAKVAAGYYVNFVLGTDGRLWHAGLNSSGQGGQGNLNALTGLNQVSTATGLTSVKDVAVGGSYHQLAVKTDGTVWGWGTQSNGEIDGTANQVLSPVQIAPASLTGAVQVAAGYAHSMALKADGTVWCWGDNGKGQLGNGTTTNSGTPLQVAGLPTIIAIAANSNSSYAITASGQVWAWGGNSKGELGINTTANSLVPVQVKDAAGTGILSNVRSLVGSPSMTNNSLGRVYAVLNNGDLYGWGAKYNDALLMTNDNQAQKLPVLLANNVSMAATNGYYGGTVNSNGVLIKNDGSVWSIGSGGSGQLGNGDMVDKATLVQVRAAPSAFLNLGPLYTPGNYVSNVLDFGAKTNSLSLAWNQTVNAGAGATQVGILIATSSDASGPWNFYGPTGNTPADCQTGGCYTANAGIGLSAAGHARYLRYKVFLDSAGSVNSPALDQINFNFDAYPSSGLLVVHKFNNGTGTLAVGQSVDDYSGNGYAATSSAATTYYDVGKFGNSLSFNGGVLSNYDFKRPSLYSFSISTWFKSNATGTLVSLGRYSGATSYAESGMGLYYGQILARVIKDGSYSWGTLVTATSTYNDNIWHHTVMAYDGNSRTLSLFVDGQLATSSGGVTVDMDQPIDYYRLGSGTGAHWGAFTGNLDEVMIYNRPLSASEVGRLYAIGETYQTLSSSWYNSSSDKNIVTALSWQEDPAAVLGAGVRLQVRTAYDSLSLPGTPATSSASTSDWGAFGDSAGGYFSSSTPGCSKDGAGLVTCLIPNTSGSVLGDGLGDQWYQYRVLLDSDGQNNPSFDNFGIRYVVNNPPEIQGLAAWQVATATDQAFGRVQADFAIRDVDTDDGSPANRGKVSLRLEYCTANCAVAGSEIWQAAQEDNLQYSAGSSTVAVATSTFTSYSLSWNAKADYVDNFISSLPVRLIADDHEAANNLIIATTSIMLDTRNPAVGPSGTSSKINALPATSSSAILTFDMLDDSPLYYQASTLSDFSDLGDVWTSYPAAAPTTAQIDLGSRPDKIHVRFRDEYNNVSSTTINIPTTPTIVMIQDTSNVIDTSTPEYRLFLSWKKPTDALGTFRRYNIFRSYSTSSLPDFLGSVEDYNQNFYIDTTMASGTDVYYYATLEDIHGNISYLSDTMWGSADGTQNRGEGGGGSGNGINSPTISNISVASIYANQAVIEWETDVVSDSLVFFATDPLIDWASSTASSTGNATLVDNAANYGKHRVVLTGLQPGTAYYYKVQSVNVNDVAGYIFADAGGNPLSLTTLNGASIMPGSVEVIAVSNTTADIAWTTDQSSDANSVVYGTSVDSDGNIASPQEAIGDNYGASRHLVRLTGLTPGKIYRFYVKSGNSVDKQTIGAEDRFYSLTTTNDTVAPIVTVRQGDITPTDHSAVIQFTTDKPATSTVTISSGAFSTSSDNNSFNSSNHYIIDGLSPAVGYNITITATDQNGNTGTANSSFTTLSAPDAVGPTISTTTGWIAPSPNHAVITFYTNDEPGSGYVEYANSTTSFETDKLEVGSDQLGSLHAITLAGLSQNSTYYFRLRSADASGNVSYQPTAASNDFFELTTYPGPTISGISTSTTETTATISWTTSEAADGYVIYGAPDLANSLEKGNPAKTTSHTVTMSGLNPGTSYQFKLKSTNANNGLTIYPDGPALSFVTALGPLAISNVATSSVSDKSAVITWNVSRAATSKLYYGLATGTFDQLAADASYTTSPTIILSGLASSTAYRFQIINIDDLGRTATSVEDLSFTTLETQHGQAEIDQLSQELALKSAQITDLQAQLAQAKASAGGGGVITITKTIDKQDKTAPVISDVQVGSLTATSAVVSWLTDEEANTFVNYGAGSANDDAYGLASLTKNHRALLKNLEPGRAYDFYVSSADGSGNLTLAKNQSFTTLQLTPEQALGLGSSTAGQAVTPQLVQLAASKVMDMMSSLSQTVSLGAFETTVLSQFDALNKFSQLIPAPVLGGEPATEITPTTVTIRWKTDKSANSMVAYAPEVLFAQSKGAKGYLQLVGEPDQLVTDHQVKIVGLKPDTSYHYQLRSKGKLGSEGISRDFTFHTRPEALEIISVNTETLSKDAAKFSWLTSQEANTELSYIPYRNGSLSMDEVKVIHDKTLTTNHVIEINDLEAGVVYQLQIAATDKKGVRIQKVISFFSTTKDDLPPEIADIQTESALSQSKEAKVQTIITWTTNEPTISQVKFAKGVFENEQDLTEETPIEAVYSRKHTIVVTKFEIGEVYSFRVVATDSGGNKSVSSPHIILTPKQKEGVFELIINTFESTFGWLGQMK